MAGRRSEGHPGVPEYCEEEGSGPLGYDPAARVVRKSPSSRGEGGGGDNDNNRTELPADPTARIKCSETATLPRTSPARAPILGDIVERRPTATGPRPPSGGASRGLISSGLDKESTVVTVSDNSRNNGDREGEDQEIDAENRKILASMSDQEILAEQALLKKTLPPRLVERWSRPSPPDQ